MRDYVYRNQSIPFEIITETNVLTLTYAHNVNKVFTYKVELNEL